MAISSRTVLIVAGDARSAEAFHHSLDHEAHRLYEVSCLKDALAIVARESVDVVVADTALPDGTGLALLLEVRRIQPATMRVLLTSPAGVGTALQAMEHGDVYRFLVKPWDGVELRGVVRAAVDRLYRERENSQLLDQVKGEICRAIASANPELQVVRDSTGSILLDDTEERAAVSFAVG
ncbi:MAG TPA: response regulator [Myxococcaceae bacterium]|nr:response regulator [Myxococcaceae bacterium]